MLHNIILNNVSSSKIRKKNYPWIAFHVKKKLGIRFYENAKYMLHPFFKTYFNSSFREKNYIYFNSSLKGKKSHDSLVIERGFHKATRYQSDWQVLYPYLKD